MSAFLSRSRRTRGDRTSVEKNQEEEKDRKKGRERAVGKKIFVSASPGLADERKEHPTNKANHLRRPSESCAVGTEEERERKGKFAEDGDYGHEEEKERRKRQEDEEVEEDSKTGKVRTVTALDQEQVFPLLFLLFFFFE